MKLTMPQISIVFFMLFTIFGILANILTIIGWDSVDEVVFSTSETFEGFALRHFLWGILINLLFQLHYILPHVAIILVFSLSLIKFNSLYKCSQLAALIFISPVILLYAQTVLRDFTYFSILLLILCYIQALKTRSNYVVNRLMLLCLLCIIGVLNPIFTLTIIGAFLFALLVGFVGKWQSIFTYVMSVFTLLLVVDVIFPTLSTEILYKIARIDQTCGSLGYWGNYGGNSVTIFTLKQLIGNIFIFEDLGVTFLFKLEHFLYMCGVSFAVYKARTRRNFNNAFCVGILLTSFFQLVGENCEWSLIRHKIIFYAPLLILLSQERSQNAYKSFNI